MKPLYSRIASLLEAIQNCEKRGNMEWFARHKENLDACIDTLPRGSGIDRGWVLTDQSTPDRLVFSVSFHHMDEHGGYDGWTDHAVFVTPSLAHGINVRITGPDRDDIKAYLADVLGSHLHEDREVLGGVR